MTFCGRGDLLVFPEDADGRVLPKPRSRLGDDPSGHISGQPEGSAEQDEQLVPWRQPAALDADLDPEAPNPPAAAGPQQYVHGCLLCADSAHDFAMAERKVGLADAGGICCFFTPTSSMR